MKSRLRPTDTATQDIGDLLVAQMMQISEDQHFAVFFRQMIPQIVEDTPLEFAFNDHAFRINTVGGDGNSFKAEGGMSSPLPVFVPEEVDSDLS